MLLTKLFIQNIVLIKQITLEWTSNLNILTGETGAGKSILMDALTLALGGRSDISLIRNKEAFAQVIAEFEDVNNNVKHILYNNFIECDNTLILKRVITNDGKSKAFINDVPVSIKLLKEVGDNLVEVYGQFESHYLLDQINHKKILDEFGIIHSKSYKDLLNQVKLSYNDLDTTNKEYKKLLIDYERYSKERDFLEYSVKELESLNIQPDEEEKLTEQRNRVIAINKNKEVLNNINDLINEQELDEKIFTLINLLEKIHPNPYIAEIEKLYETTNVLSIISDKINILDDDEANIDDIEERLFKIKELSRKYGVNSNKLNYKLEELNNQLQNVEDFENRKLKLENEKNKKTKNFIDLANALSQERKKISDILRDCILKELPDLKLGQADFKVAIEEGDYSETGFDNITFYVRTNIGGEFAPLQKCVSGGELSRLMLSMRVVLGCEDKVFVFDEIDTGISGSVASAVGSRLQRLASKSQVLVITHSPQVAGYGYSHYKITKIIQDNDTETIVKKLNENERIEEIARIISGKNITPESLATAKTLIIKN